jgi:hypothetical protein
MAKIHTERFSPADELDGPAEGEDLTQPAPAVALRFDYDPDVVTTVKGIFHSVRYGRSGRGRPVSHIPQVGGWSKRSKCWWVRSTFWPEVRQVLLGKGIALVGPAAHPGQRKVGLFERTEVWDSQACVWR